MKVLLSKNRLLSGMFLSVLLFSSLVVSVKAEALMWRRTYGGAEIEGAYSLVETSDGGYAVVGFTSSISVGEGGLLVSSADFWFVKTDVFGNMEWNQTYGGAGNDEAFSLVATSDGGYAIAGRTNSFGDGEYDCWLVKTDASGNMLWNSTCRLVLHAKGLSLSSD